MSPVYILVGFYTFTALCSYYVIPQFHKSVSFFYIIVLSNEQYDLTFRYFLFLISAFILGVLIQIFLFPAQNQNVEDGDSLEQGNFNLLASPEMILLLSIPLVLMVQQIGMGDLLQRDYYRTGHDTSIQAISKPLIPFVTMACGFAVGGTGPVFVKVLGGLLALMYELLALGMSSRLFAVVPLAFALGLLVARPRSRAVRSIFLGTIAVSPAALLLPLLLREQHVQGIFPFFSRTMWRLFDFVDEKHSFGFVLSNVMFSFPLTGFVLSQPPLKTRYLLTDFNPMPGALTDWYSIWNRFRFNSFVPFNAIGELGNVSVFFGAAFFVVLGIFFAYLDRRSRRWMDRGWAFPAIVILGLTSLFVLLSLQYQLRSSLRLLYYLGIVDVGFALIEPYVKPLHQTSDY
jgi:hypothetical protein